MRLSTRLVLTWTLGSTAYPAAAQAPQALSHGLQDLPISYEECLRRAGAALRSEENGQLVCTNESGRKSRCRADSPTQITALGWEGGLVGTLSADKRTLNWRNNTSWSR